MSSDSDKTTPMDTSGTSVEKLLNSQHEETRKMFHAQAKTINSAHETKSQLPLPSITQVEKDFVLENVPKNPISPGEFQELLTRALGKWCTLKPDATTGKFIFPSSTEVDKVRNITDESFDYWVRAVQKMAGIATSGTQDSLYLVHYKNATWYGQAMASDPKGKFGLVVRPSRTSDEREFAAPGTYTIAAAAPVSETITLDSLQTALLAEYGGSSSPYFMAWWTQNSKAIYDCFLNAQEQAFTFKRLLQQYALNVRVASSSTIANTVRKSWLKLFPDSNVVAAPTLQGVMNSICSSKHTGAFHINTLISAAIRTIDTAPLDRNLSSVAYTAVEAMNVMREITGTAEPPIWYFWMIAPRFYRAVYHKLKFSPSISIRENDRAISRALEASELPLSDLGPTTIPEMKDLVRKWISDLLDNYAEEIKSLEGKAKNASDRKASVELHAVTQHANTVAAPANLPPTQPSAVAPTATLATHVDRIKTHGNLSKLNSASAIGAAYEAGKTGGSLPDLEKLTTANPKKVGSNSKNTSNYSLKAPLVKLDTVQADTTLLWGSVDLNSSLFDTGSSAMLNERASLWVSAPRLVPPSCRQTISHEGRIITLDRKGTVCLGVLPDGTKILIEDVWEYKYVDRMILSVCKLLGNPHSNLRFGTDESGRNWHLRSSSGNYYFPITWTDSQMFVDFSQPLPWIDVRSHSVVSLPFPYELVQKIHKSNHIPYADIVRLGRKNGICGLTPEDLRGFDCSRLSCGECVMGRMTDASHKARSAPPATKSGDHISFDIYGPHTPASREGYRYYALVVDEFSHFRWVLPLKKKSQFLGLKHFSSLFMLTIE